MPATVKIEWSKEEDGHLLKLKEAGYSNQAIADSVGRPRSTVGHRLLELFDAMPKEKSAELRRWRPSPNTPAPTLRNEFLSARASDWWTEEIDAQITELRQNGMAYARIGLIIGRNGKTVYERLIKLSATEVLVETSSKPRGFMKFQGSGRADYQPRPAGPAPSNPEPPKNPRSAGWRKCLGDDCGRFFWSPNAGCRRCERCRKLLTRSDGHGDGSRVIDTPELCLHL